MSDSFLSQEEIDALLRNEAAPSPAAASNNTQLLSEVEIDALGEIGNISMGSAATTMSVLLQRRVEITTPKVSVSMLDDMKREFPTPYVIVEVRFTEGVNGTNLLAIKEADAAIEKLNNSDLDGRTITVNEARPKEDKPRRDFGGDRGGNGGGSFRQRSW